MGPLKLKKKLFGLIYAYIPVYAYIYIYIYIYTRSFMAAAVPPRILMRR